MGIWREGIGSMWQRYRTVWKNVWSIREQLDPPKREGDERAFLPAHLELMETPVSGAPKWAARLIILFFVITLLWAIFGKMDIVATAQGKTVLSKRSKVIKSLEDAGVVHIYVENGQKVEKNEPLAELDFLGAKQDYEKAHEGLKASTLTTLRSTALLKAINEIKVPIIDDSDTSLISEEELVMAERLINSQYQLWRSQDERLAAAIRQRQAEYKTIEAQVTKLKKTLELTEEQVLDYEKMLTKNQKGISKHAYYEKKQSLINNTSELESQESKLKEIEESVIQQEKGRELITQQLQRDTLDQLREAHEMRSQYKADRERAEHRQKQAMILAPTSGTIQQLEIHTEGGVVSHGEMLMTVVPEEDFMEVEALVPNKDIGFIEKGQEVAVKIESFPYTRYGYVTGKVKSISFDAIEHEEYGLVFQAIIQLDKDYLIINSKKIPLSAGMNVTAEIKIRDRRVINYFLSPLQTKVEESMREL